MGWPLYQRSRLTYANSTATRPWLVRSCAQFLAGAGVRGITFSSGLIFSGTFEAAGHYIFLWSLLHMGSHGEDPFACLHLAPWQEALKSCWDACMLWYCTLQHCCWVCCRQPAVPSKVWHTRERFPQVWKNKGALKSLWAAYIQKLSEKKIKGKQKKKRNKHELNASFVEFTHLCNGFQPFSNCSLPNSFQQKCWVLDFSLQACLSHVPSACLEVAPGTLRTHRSLCHGTPARGVSSLLHCARLRGVWSSGLLPTAPQCRWALLHRETPGDKQGCTEGWRRQEVLGTDCGKSGQADF